MNPQTIDFGSAVIRMVGGLAIVLSLVFALAYLLKRLSKLSAGNGDDKLLRVISTHRINPKQAIAIYQVGNKAFLLGISQENITFLTDIPLEELELKSTSTETSPKRFDNSFAERLRSLMNLSDTKAKKEIEA